MRPRGSPEASAATFRPFAVLTNPLASERQKLHPSFASGPLALGALPLNGKPLSHTYLQSIARHTRLANESARAPGLRVDDGIGTHFAAL